MLRQIKFLILLFPGFACCISITAQSSYDSVINRKIDSLNEVLVSEFNRRLQSFQYRTSRIIKEQELKMNKLGSEILQLEKELENLKVMDQELNIQLALSENKIANNKLIIEKERANLKRVLFIAGPSILVLILVTVLLYFMLMLKYQEQTDKKINALRKYTHIEIEESRSDLLRKFRKRIKKVSEGLAGKDNSRKKKTKKAKAGKQE